MATQAGEKHKDITKTDDPLEYIKRIQTVEKGVSMIQVLGSFVNRNVCMIETRDRGGSWTNVYLNPKQLRELAKACTDMAKLIKRKKKK